MNAPRREERARRRFWARTVRCGACLLWAGSCDPEGYGRFYYSGSTKRAHRVAFYWATGRWVPLVRHTCDTPHCVEPSHLLAGTQADNLSDAYARGRKDDRGSANGFSKLTEAQVLEIRSRHAAGETQRALAKHFGLNANHVWDIVHRRRWAHV